MSKSRCIPRPAYASNQARSAGENEQIFAKGRQYRREGLKFARSLDVVERLRKYALMILRLKDER